LGSADRSNADAAHRREKKMTFLFPLALSLLAVAATIGIVAPIVTGEPSELVNEEIEIIRRHLEDE
jgi:hypothetical protein